MKHILGWLLIVLFVPWIVLDVGVSGLHAVSMKKGAIAIQAPVSAPQDIFGPREARATRDVVAAPRQGEDGYVTQIRLSHYWPAWGGPNCSRFVRGECISRMASGLRWQDWIGRAAACPREWPFWTEIILSGGEKFYCLDRGGRIRFVGGIAWVDLLVKVPPVPFGTIIDAWVIPPGVPQ